MKNLLTARTYQVDGNWYAPEEFLQGFSSVVKTELFNTTSSAGDWDGYFIQKILNRYYLIIFSQVNNGFGASGFTLYTDRKPKAVFKDEPSRDTIYDILFNKILKIQ